MSDEQFLKAYEATLFRQEMESVARDWAKNHISAEDRALIKARQRAKVLAGAEHETYAMNASAPPAAEPKPMTPQEYVAYTIRMKARQR